MNSALYGQLIVFHTIATQKSISGAARQLEVGAPAISKSLKLLETHIGLPLFNRTTRHIELTETGQLLLKNTAELVQSLQYAVESVQDLGNKPFGNVRITVARFAYQCFLKHRLAEFHQRYPDITLEISINDGVVDILEQGFDLGIRFGDRVTEDMVTRQILAPFKEGLYVSNDYITQHGKPETPTDLAKHHVIGYRFITANRVLPLIVNDNNREITIDMPHYLLTNDIEVIIDSTRQGLGIGRIFEPVYEQLRDKEDFIPVLEKYWNTYPAVYLYYLQHSQKAQRIRALIDFLAEK